MARLSILDRRGLVSSFAATLEHNAEQVGTGFREMIEPLLEPGEEAPDMTLAARLLDRSLRSRFRSLVDRDRADFDERAGDAVPRERRDRQTKHLHDKLVALRQVVEVTYGKAYSQTLVPIKGRTPRSPAEVHLEAQHTLTLLKDPERELPAPAVRGVATDLREWARELEPLVAELGASLEEVASEQKKASAKNEEKRKSIEDLDSFYSHASSVVRGLLFLAGLEKAAQELPSLNRVRRSRRGPAPPDPTPPDPTPPDDEPQGGEPQGGEPQGGEPQGDDPQSDDPQGDGGTQVPPDEAELVDR